MKKIQTFIILQAKGLRKKKQNKLFLVSEFVHVFTLSSLPPHKLVLQNELKAHHVFRAKYKSKELLINIKGSTITL